MFLFTLDGGVPFCLRNLMVCWWAQTLQMNIPWPGENQTKIRPSQPLTAFKSLVRIYNYSPDQNLTSNIGFQWLLSASSDYRFVPLSQPSQLYLACCHIHYHDHHQDLSGTSPDTLNTTVCPYLQMEAIITPLVGTTSFVFISQMQKLSHQTIKITG